MKKWKVFCTGLVTLAGLAPSLWAQVPAIPAGPPDLATAPTSGPAPSKLASFLGLTKDQKEAMKRKCCKTPLGQFINNSLAPMRAFSGGMVGNFCPTTPSLADQAKAGPEGMASKVQADEAAAKAKRAALRYLATVDCHFWPEVQDALIAGLRAERNECVRWEAAMALGGGCCCTKKTMEALLISATASDRDGNPAETCERVRAAAYSSLQHCLACFSQEVAAEPGKKPGPELPVPEKPAPEKVGKPTASATGDAPVLTAYYSNLGRKPMALTIEEARKACEHFSVGTTAGLNVSSGHRGLADIVAATMYGPSSKPAGPESSIAEGSPSTEQSPIVERTPFRDPMPVKPALATEPKSTTTQTADYKVSVPTTRPATPTPMQSTPPAPAPVPSMPAIPAPAAPPTQSRATPGPNAQQLMLVLRNSSYPFQREWAVNELSNVDWHGNPEVVQALLNAAQKDSAPTVRVSCVHALAKMKVDTIPVATTMKALKADTDPRVQREATAALGQMRSVETVSATPFATTGVVIPASATARPGSTPVVTPAYRGYTTQPSNNAFSQ